MSLEQQNRDVTAEILHCSIGADLVAKLRSLEREDLRELAGRSLPPLVELQVAWLLRDIAKLEEILTTSSSHAVRIRASTALLKLDPAKLLRLISPEAGEEPSPLSSSCRHAALASLARLGHSALPTSLTLLNLKGLGARRTAARILLKAAKEPELVREQWPLLLRSLPFKAAFSMACRMPGLCLELLLQLPPPWPPQQLARVASVAVSASPEDALRLMQREQRSQGRWLVEPLTLAIVKGLSRKMAPEDMLRALGQWLPAPRRKPPDGLPEQWGALLARLAERASRRGEHLWPQVLGTTIQLMNCFDSGSAATLLVATLVKLPFGQLEVVTDQQLAEFFNSVELQHLGDVFQSLRAKGIAEQRLDAVPIRTVEATEALVKHFGQLQRLSSWPRLARQRLSQQLTSSKPMEVAGGQAPEVLGVLQGWQRCTKGYVVGWSAIADATPAPEGMVCNNLPAVVYVKFDTATSWQISGVPDANVYPVVTCRRVWYLDRQRRSPKLRVSRTQFPLAPQFAITAHVAQGQTIKEGVTTDLCIGPRGNPFTVYVAVTRVQGREKLLIFRPFDAAPFQKGIGLGRDLLLRHLRREPINWQDLLAKYCEERACSTCAERKPSTAFTAGQWKRDDKDRVCRECTKHYADAGTPWQCNVCKLWHVETNFPEKHRQRQCSFFRVCLTCEMKKPCFKCGVAKPEAEFGPAAWKARNAD
ncbi:unnamed protein product, partial [Cladocopium goreaui]